VTGAVNAYTSNDPMLRAADGHTSVIVVWVRKNAPMMARTMAVDAMRSAAHNAVPGATVQVGGDLGVMRDGMLAAKSDLFRGEALALPVLLIALFFIFRGWRAAMLPIAAALLLLVQLPITGALGENLSWSLFTGAALVAATVMVLVSVGCALYPAWRASRLSPTEALHYE